MIFEVFVITPPIVMVASSCSRDLGSPEVEVDVDVAAEM